MLPRPLQVLKLIPQNLVLLNYMVSKAQEWGG
jgi:hypothetical protein